MRLQTLIGVCALAVAGLAACGGGGGSTPAGPGTGPGGSQASVVGRVLDAQDGTPIAGAKLTAGGVTAMSDANGAYVLTNVVPDARLALVADAGNYTEAVKLTSSVANATTTFDVKLLKVATTAQLTQAAGGVVTVVGSAAQVTLPPNFAVRANGAAPIGSVTVKLTPIAPAADSSLMPGDYTTVSGSQVVSIESFGALTVNLTDSDGAALNLASGKTATVRIAVSTRSDVSALPATIPLYYVSAQTGRWVEEGSASLQGTAPNQYYQGTVSHFSTWNADRVLDSVVVTGCVKDEAGLAVANVQMRSDGIDYSGTSSALTDASGQFRIVIKKSSRATLGGYIGNKFSNEISVGPSAVDFNAATCLSLATAATSIKVKLTWGTSPSDLDSYVTLPTGEVIYYSNRGNLLAAPFINLDVDDTSSFGPEVVTIRKPMVGTYKYAVRNYSQTHTPGITGSPAKVELTVGSNTSIYAPPAGEPTSGPTVWSVFNLTVSATCGVTITPINTWSIVSPPTTVGPVAVYCAAP